MKGECKMTKQEIRVKRKKKRVEDNIKLTIYLTILTILWLITLLIVSLIIKVWGGNPVVWGFFGALLLALPHCIFTIIN